MALSRMRLYGLPTCCARLVQLSRFVQSGSTGDWEAECLRCRRIAWLDQFSPHPLLNKVENIAYLHGLRDNPDVS